MPVCFGPMIIEWCFSGFSAVVEFELVSSTLLRSSLFFVISLGTSSSSKVSAFLRLLYDSSLSSG